MSWFKLFFVHYFDLVHNDTNFPKLGLSRKRCLHVRELGATVDESDESTSLKYYDARC